VIEIKIATKDDCEEVQGIFNHRDIIGLLGGFNHLKTIQDSVKPITAQVSVWYARDTDSGKVVGATMLGGRPQSHLAKYGMVGVLPEFQRKGIGRALYFAMTAQGVLEGRRLFEDTIVGDNPTQFTVLPRLGLRQAGELRHRTGSAKSIFLFQLSLLDEAALEKIWPKHVVHIRENHYSREVHQKNLELYQKHTPGILDTIATLRNSFRQMSYIRLEVDLTDPTKDRRAQFERKSLIEGD
jgi:GNAT superfamily N-acetyltransferase